jgi:hypothetical protein
LDEADVAMMAFAEKMALHAYKITPVDIADLQRLGFSDVEILDMALAAAARTFFSKLMDALGAEPDERYFDLSDSLRQALVVGRQFGTSNPLMDAN